MIKVLIVELENRSGDSIARAVNRQGMQPTVLYDGDQALEHLDCNSPDAVILSVGSQGNRGQQLCRAVCGRTLAPVLVAGRGNQEAVVELVLDAGADAHVLEPFAEEVLVAQLWALLRRVGFVVHAREV